MNYDRSYRRHWFYTIDHSRGRRGIRYNSFGCFSCIKKMLGRIEMRTRDRIYCQTIRTVTHITRDDRARIVTCSMRTPTDRLKENYSIPNTLCSVLPTVYDTCQLLNGCLQRCIMQDCFGVKSKHNMTYLNYHDSQRNTWQDVGTDGIYIHNTKLKVTSR